MIKNKIAALDTEQRNVRSKNFSSFSTEQMVETIALEDSLIANEIQKQKKAIAKLINTLYKQVKVGGRLIYIGAGTSGKIGSLDATEIHSTFGAKDKVFALIAGGTEALYKPLEGFEDSPEQIIDHLKELNVTNKDVIVGLSASGRTPYVISGLKYAKELGSKNALICNSNTKISDFKVDHIIFINTGPEVITGSTRMKAATSQKMVCNILTTSLMTKLGYVRENYMVNVVPNNLKLEQRCINMIADIAKISYEEAQKSFNLTSNVVISLYMILDKLSLEKAKAKYAKNYQN